MSNLNSEKLAGQGRLKTQDKEEGNCVDWIGEKTQSSLY